MLDRFDKQHKAARVWQRIGGEGPKTGERRYAGCPARRRGLWPPEAPGRRPDGARWPPPRRSPSGIVGRSPGRRWGIVRAAQSFGPFLDLLPFHRLADAAIAVAEGRSEEARTLLADIPPDHPEPSVRWMAQRVARALA